MQLRLPVDIHSPSALTVALFFGLPAASSKALHLLENAWHMDRAGYKWWQLVLSGMMDNCSEVRAVSQNPQYDRALVAHSRHLHIPCAGSLPSVSLPHFLGCLSK